MAAGTTRISAPRRGHRNPSGAVNIYEYTRSAVLAPISRHARPLVYVPNSRSRVRQRHRSDDLQRHNELSKTGAVPQHVVPSYELARLWCAQQPAGHDHAIDPTTGQEGRPIGVDDPLQQCTSRRRPLRHRRRRAQCASIFGTLWTMRLVDSVKTDCRGIDHIEFTADGRFSDRDLRVQ
jgi:hypothetical protein